MKNRLTKKDKLYYKDGGFFNKVGEQINTGIANIKDTTVKDTFGEIGDQANKVVKNNTNFKNVNELGTEALKYGKDAAVIGGLGLLQTTGMGVPISALTGKSLDNLVGYEAETKAGKLAQRGTQTMAGLQGAAAPMAANIFAPGSGAVVSAAQQGIGNIGALNNPNQAQSFLPQGVTNSAVGMASQFMEHGGKLTQFKGGIKGKTDSIEIMPGVMVNHGETAMKTPQGDFVINSTSDKVKMALGGINPAKESKKIEKLREFRKNDLLTQNMTNKFQNNLSLLSAKIGSLLNPDAAGYEDNGVEEYKYGGIHIKESNKGKFTASAKAAGRSVQEHAHAVVNNPNSTELQRKRAQFAINAKKWHHEDGGMLKYDNGGFLSPAGYAAIDQYENTSGAPGGTPMGRGEGYSKGLGKANQKEKDATKKVEDYITNVIGMDTWNKLPDDIKTQVYNIGFNMGTDPSIPEWQKDDRLDRMVKGLAQASDPNKYTNADARRNMTREEALNTIKSTDFSKGDVAERLTEQVVPDMYKSLPNTTNYHQNRASEIRAYEQNYKQPTPPIPPTLPTNPTGPTSPTGPTIFGGPPSNDPGVLPPQGPVNTPPPPSNERLPGDVPPNQTGAITPYGTGTGITPPPPSGPDYNQIASYATLGLGALAKSYPMIQELRRLKKDTPETVAYNRIKYDDIAAKTVDPRAALAQAGQENRTTDYNMRQASAGNLGSYLSNMSAARLANARNKTNINYEYDKANAGIMNQAAQFNAANRLNTAQYNAAIGDKETDVNSQTRANYENQMFKLRQGLGDTAASALNTANTQYFGDKFTQNTNTQNEDLYAALYTNPENRAIIDKLRKR